MKKNNLRVKNHLPKSTMFEERENDPMNSLLLTKFAFVAYFKNLSFENIIGHIEAYHGNLDL